MLGRKCAPLTHAEDSPPLVRKQLPREQDILSLEDGLGLAPSLAAHDSAGKGTSWSTCRCGGFQG